MGKTLTSIAQILRPMGGGADEIVAVKLHPGAVTVSEVRTSARDIFIDNLASAALPRTIDLSNISKQVDVVADTLRSMREQGIFAAQDAGIILPSNIITLRQINLPFMSPSELAKEGRFIDFWIEAEPDLAKLEDPYINYQTLVSSENDDLTRVLLGYCEEATLRPWSDLLLSAHLNPVYLDVETVALANYRHATLPRDEKSQPQAILHFSGEMLELVAFQTGRFHSMRLEVSEFDQVLIAEIEQVDDPTGDFWDEVGGRIANSLKQAVLYLQEEHDFGAFSVIYFVNDGFLTRNILALLDRHFTLAPISLWNTNDGANASQSVGQLMGQIENKSGFAAAFGLGLRKLGTFGEKESTLFNLSMLPKGRVLRRNRQFAVISRSLIKVWTVLFLIMAGWLGLTVPRFLQSQIDSRGVEPYRAQAEQIQSQVADLASEVQGLESQIQSIQQLQQPRGRIHFIDTMPDLLPEGLELDSIIVSDDVVLQITGTARSENAITLFQSELSTNGLVADTSVAPAPTDDPNVITFSLSGTILRQD